MKQLLSITILSLCSLMSYANCDLTQYQGSCELRMHTKPTRHAHSLVYCGNVYGYLSTAQYDILSHYQRANVNINLTLNGMLMEAPCVPSGR